MNNSRRKRISKIADALNELKGQIDATCADEIVQHALFGDLVFG